jgi:hypothetical protein
MEQIYAILPIEMLDSIDWSKTYQTEETIRKDINQTQFVISKLEDSDYLSDKVWITQLEAHTIVSTDEFSGPRPNQ